MPLSLSQARIELAGCLWAARSEIEHTVRNRVFALADPTAVADPRYADDLRVAISAAIDFGIAGLEHGEQHAPVVPPILLAQARAAARHGVSLDIVIRRYLAGHAILGNHLILAMRSDQQIDGAAMQTLISDQAALLDRVVAKISDEYRCEGRSLAMTSNQRRARRVKRLLDGELIDASDLSYDFESFHTAVIAKGAGVDQALRDLSGATGQRLLLVRPNDAMTWAWFAGRNKEDLAWFERLAGSRWPPEAILAVGEGPRGVTGWRVAHRQASAAFPIAMRKTPPIVRYADVALLASIFRDDLLSISLEQRYLAPLKSERDGGKVLRETLRAYFAAGRNGASAAAALGVSRQTVSNRLEAVEGCLGRPLLSCAAEVEAALRLESIGHIE